jgi:Flp pilus assembly protein TadD
MNFIQGIRARISRRGKTIVQAQDFETVWGANKFLRLRKARWIIVISIGLVVGGITLFLPGIGKIESGQVKGDSILTLPPVQALVLEEKHAKTNTSLNSQEAMAVIPSQKNSEILASSTSLLPGERNKDTSLPTFLEKRVEPKSKPILFKISQQATRKSSTKIKSPRASEKPIKTEYRGSVLPLYEKAKWYHRQSRYDEAISLYQQAVQLAPNHFNAQFNLVSAYLETFDFDKAQALAWKLHKAHPENHHIAINLAIALIGAGFSEKAIALLDKIPSSTSQVQFEIYFYKGLAYRQLNQYEQAIASYLKAEQLRPLDTRLLFNLAILMDRERKFKNAVNYYEKYLLAIKVTNSSDRLKVEKRIQVLQDGLEQSRQR